MNMKRIVLILSIICLFSACKSRGGNQSQMSTRDNSKVSLDWNGTYFGVVPCADCPGIEVRITLNLDDTYRIDRKYQGRSDDVHVSEGTFSWDEDGSIITFENQDKTKVPTMYKVCENYLLQLDLNGNVITGELADNYVLKKEREN
jgi:uncharacterized lipoprotein NlpE involved in copper resistance